MYLATTGRRDVSPAPIGARRRVSATVLALGTVSLVTDVSSEMVTAVLPLYLVLGLGLTPLQFGFLDGLFTGATALVRLVGGHAADRGGRHKRVAGLGYALSACSRLGLLLAGGATGWIATALAADRLGKGIRTAPRDALITLDSPPDGLGRAFGVHRAMDTTGALLGPLAAFAILWATADAYDAVFVVSFCTGLLGVLLLAVLVPGGRRETTGESHRVRDLAAPLRLPAVRRVVLAAALLGAATVGDGFLYLLLQRRTDLAATWFPFLPLAASAAYLLLAVPAGRLADRTGRGRSFLYGHGALLLALGLLLAPLPGPLLLVGVPLLIGVFYAATDGVLMALTGPLLPAARRASGLALVQTVQALAKVAAAAGFGAAWTLWGPRTALVLALAALVPALGCATRLLPPGRAEPSPEPPPPSPPSASPSGGPLLRKETS
ncbi:MFS transporter [Streptomyces roseicoloratus]|uniref:MFS transporter n=1 Tax=Streptomyces roseicoloratus TaxID=2508722 RepID=A0ABY9S015_9ACTN|nr:MFS transporter [Streptomyces roseicoloratus]WMX47615.1 MFS transporter [Streptomyces roseicoloratus]